jgi:CubicO group peptidase (beta-lactamase class C family)
MRTLTVALLLSLTVRVDAQPQAKPYVPSATSWATRRPSEVALDSAKLAAAVVYAQGADNGWPTDLNEEIKVITAKEPYPEILGPVKDRAPTNGLILRHGYIVAEWGNTHQVDMTFSVAKSYLATVAGLAYDRKLIPDLHAPEGALIKDGGFDSPHDAKITWDMHLTQTSEWEGTLWDKPDVADRRLGYTRTLSDPGTVWEYNDVRVNRMALSLLRLFRRPLPEVFKEAIADPIGMNEGWVWHGYRNAYVEIDGRRMQSVSGGGHWGGGFWASTRDHARFGLLASRMGNWDGKQLVSQEWYRLATTPSPIKPVYGYMWWLNTDRKQYPAAPASSFFALGAGGNVIWIDRDHDLVAVIRWFDLAKVNEFMRLVLDSITDAKP